MTGRVSKIIMCLYVWLTCGEVLAQQAPCMSYMDSIRVMCFENYTPLDSTDDFYRISFWVFGGSGSQTDSFSLSWEGNTGAGYFAYGTYHELEFPADGREYTLYAIDRLQVECRDSFITPALISCSAPCRFDTAVHVEIHCNNATTVSNTADDYYSISFEIPSLSTKEGYIVYLDGDSMGIFPYNQLNYINHPADSLHHVISFKDTHDESCFFTTILGRFVPCSADCYIEKQFLQMECHNNDTPFEISDDSVYITYLITTFKGSDSFLFYIDDVWVATMSYGDTLQMVLPYSGTPLTIKMEDQLKNSCVFFDTWILPEACSIDCSQVADIEVNAGEDVILTCLEPCTTLIADRKPGFQSQWKNISTGEIFHEDSLLRCGSGLFALIYTHSENGCPGGADSLSIEIDTSIIEPEVKIESIGSEPCISSRYLLKIIPEPSQDYHWNHHNQLWYEDSIEVEGPASILAVAHNTRNGCRDSLLLDLPGPLGFAPLHLLPIDTLTCLNKEITLSIAGPPQPEVGYFWKKEGIDTLWKEGTQLKVTEAGFYILRLIYKEDSCQKDTVVQVVDASQTLQLIIPEIPLLNCQEDSFSFTVNVYNQNGEWLAPEKLNFEKAMTTGHWLPSANGALNFAGQGAGQYVIKATHIEDGCEVSDTIEVQSTLVPAIIWQAIDETCYHKSDGKVNLSGPYQMVKEWSIGGNKQNGMGVENLMPGTYTITAVDTLGCHHDTLITISAAEELKIMIDAEVEIAYGQTKLLRAEINRNESELLAYGWSPEEKVSCVSCMEAWIEGKEDGQFQFKATDLNGCVAEASVRVKIERNVIITAPNIIALDISGNNQFTVYGNEQVKRVNELKIYDRWGNAIWQTTTDCLNQPSLGWNGTINGTQIETGVYTYVAEVEIFTGEKTVISGDITWVK